MTQHKARSTMKGFTWGAVFWVSLLSFVQDTMGLEAWIAFERAHWMSPSPWIWVLPAGVALMVIVNAALSEMVARRKAEDVDYQRGEG